MEIQNLIPSGMEEKLKCSSCKNYLSYFPIFISCENQNFCGRCTTPEGSTSYQNEPFEVVCQSFKFPCRYKNGGCCEELVPKEVPLHEEKCPFREVPCVINKPVACQWKGNLPSLVQHCQIEHSDVILKDGQFQMDLSMLEEKQTLIEQEKDLYLFMRRFDPEENLLSCGLFNFYKQTESPQTALLNIKNGDRSVSLDLEVGEIEEKEDLNELYLHSLKSRKNEVKLVQGKITFMERNIEEKKDNEEISIVSSVLQCSQCKKTALPPICRGDGTDSFTIVCANCQNPYLDSCFSCDRFYQSEDFVLTELAKTLNYPCQNRTRGCTYSDKPSNMKNHQITCDFTSVNCAFDKSCTTTCLKKDLLDHINQTHQDLMTDFSEIMELTLNDEVTKFKILKYGGNLFRLAYVSSVGSRCKWSVQVLGNCEKDFKYRIDLIDGSGKDMQFSVMRACSEWTDGIFTDSEKYCYFDWNQISYLQPPQKSEVAKIGFRVEIKT